MRSLSKALAGLLVVAVGLVFLAANLGWLKMGAWELLARYWPVLLIGAGIVVLTGGRLGTVVVVLILLAVAVWAGSWFGWSGLALERSVFESQGPLSEVSVLRAEVDLTAARLSTAGPGGRLYSISIDHRPGGATHTFTSEAGTGNLRIDATGAMPLNFRTGRSPETILEFRPDVALDLDLSLTAGEADLDFRRYNVQRLDVHGGAGRIKVRFGDPQGQVASKVTLTTGEVEAWVPRNASLRVWGQVTIGEREFSEAGLSRVDGYWQDQGYGDATSRIDLELQTTIGRVVLKRY